jgi:hypothetical protein
MASLLRSRSVLSATTPSAIRSAALLSTQSCILGTRTLSTLRTSQLQVGPLPHRTSSRTQSHTYTLSRRAASTATRAQSELPAAARVHVLRSPSEADLEAAEVDAELLPPKDIAFQLTERAAEVSSLYSTIGYRTFNPLVPLNLDALATQCSNFVGLLRGKATRMSHSESV